MKGPVDQSPLPGPGTSHIKSAGDAFCTELRLVYMQSWMWRIIVETDAITSRQTTLLRSTYVPVHIMEL
jgi:hypothetical protein